MERQEAAEYYFFPPAYWARLAALGGHLVRFDAHRGGEVVASALCLTRRPLAPLPPRRDRRRGARPRRVESPALHGGALGPGARPRGIPPRRRRGREGGLALRLQAALQPGRPSRVLGREACTRRGCVPPPLGRRRDPPRQLFPRLPRARNDLGAHAGRRSGRLVGRRADGPIGRTSIAPGSSTKTHSTRPVRSRSARREEPPASLPARAARRRSDTAATSPDPAPARPSPTLREAELHWGRDRRRERQRRDSAIHPGGA